MKDELAWLSDALASNAVVLEWNNFYFGPGFIRATDGRITAQVPHNSQHEALVPGKELMRISKACTVDPKLKVRGEGNVMEVRAGRLSARVPVMPGNIDLNVGEEWEPVPPELVEKMKRLRPFISSDATHLWAMGLILTPEYLVCTNNVAFAASRCNDLPEGQGLIVPVWAIDFILSRPDITHWQWQDNYVAFKWHGGAIMRASLIDATFPGRVLELLEMVEGRGEQPQNVTDEFKQVYSRVGPVADSYIDIYEDRVEVEAGAASITEAVGIKGCAVTGTRWTTKALGVVIDNCHNIDVTTYPQVCAWQGDDIFGLILGRSK